jgi:hypothetical protein
VSTSGPSHPGPRPDQPWVPLEGGRLDGGFICGHCGASTLFSVAPGDDLPPCRECGRLLGGAGVATVEGSWQQQAAAFVEEKGGLAGMLAATFPETVADAQRRVLEARRDAPPRPRLELHRSWSWEDRPRFRLWCDWIDVSRMAMSVSWGSYWGDPMWSIDLEVGSPPWPLRRLADWANRRERERTRRGP